MKQMPHKVLSRSFLDSWGVDQGVSGEVEVSVVGHDSSIVDLCCHFRTTLQKDRLVSPPPPRQGRQRGRTP